MTTGFLSSLRDDLVEVVGDLADGLVGEHLGVRVGLLDRLGVVGPAGRQRRVAGLLEDRRPAVPAARQQPQAVDEHDRLQAGRVRARDLLGLVLGDRRRRCWSRTSVVPPWARVATFDYPEVRCVRLRRMTASYARRHGGFQPARPRSASVLSCARISWATGPRCPYCTARFRRRGGVTPWMLALTAAIVLLGVAVMLVDRRATSSKTASTTASPRSTRTSTRA